MTGAAILSLLMLSPIPRTPFTKQLPGNFGQF
jgi:hypothetical protein